MRTLWREITDHWFLIFCCMMAVAVAVVIGACGAAPSPTPREDRAEEVLNKSVYVKDVPMPNGRYVTCVFFDPAGGDNGALSCDWVKYNSE